MRSGVHKLFGFVLPFLFLWGCEKEPVTPELEVHSPDHGFRADVGDTLTLDVEASSGDGLARLHVSIIGKSFQKRVSPHSYDLGGKEKIRRKFDYPVGSPGQLAYDHSLRIMVETQSGKKRTRYVTGRISKDPVSFERAFVVFRPASQKLNVDHFEDPSSGLQDFKNLNMDYSGSATNSQHGEFLVAGSDNGDLRAFHAIQGHERWSAANQGGGIYPYFLDLFGDREGKWVLASLGTQRLKGYRGGSGPDYTADALNDYLIREAVKVDDRLLTEQEPIGNDPRQWVTYYASTGSIGTQKQIPDRNIVRILESSPSKAIVLANEKGQGKLFRYDVQGRYFEKLAGLPSGKLQGGLRMSDGRTLLVHDQGLLVHQKGSNVIEVMSSAVPQAIAYDKVEDRIFIGEGKEFRVLGADSGNLRWQKSCSDSIKGIHVLYDE